MCWNSASWHVPSQCACGKCGIIREKIKYIIFIALIILVPVSIMQDKSIFGDAKIFVKLFGFGTVFLMSLFVFRPFCKYFCPFGVFLGLFNKISPFRYNVDSSCNKCELCRKKCKMGIKPYENPNSVEYGVYKMWRVYK